MDLSTPVQKFANVFLVPSGRDVFVSGELSEKRGEIGFGELPFEWLCGCFPVVLEIEQTFRQLLPDR